MNKPNDFNETNLSTTNNLIDMEALLDNLKKEDSRISRILKSAKWMYIILVFSYALMFVINPDKDLTIMNRVAGICYILAFTYLAILFRKYFKDQQKTDYSLSSSEMLANAAEKYKMNYRQLLQIVPALLLIDAGISITAYYANVFVNFEPVYRILLVQAFYIPVLVISFIIGYSSWHKRQKPLRDKALEMLKKLNEE